MMPYYPRNPGNRFMPEEASQINLRQQPQGLREFLAWHQNTFGRDCLLADMPQSTRHTFLGHAPEKLARQ